MATNPPADPGPLGALPFGNTLNDSLELARRLWGATGLPSLPAAPGVAPFAQGLPGGLPSLIAPTFDVAELDKRIADLRAVEHWLSLNVSMLSTTIQTLEVQRNTIATLKSFTGAMLSSFAPATDAGAGAGRGSAPDPGAVKTARPGWGREGTTGAALTGWPNVPIQRPAAATGQAAPQATQPAAAPAQSPWGDGFFGLGRPPTPASASAGLAPAGSVPPAVPGAVGAADAPAARSSSAADSPVGDSPAADSSAALPPAAAALAPLPINAAQWWGALQDQFTRIAAATVAFGAAGEAAAAERRKAEGNGAPGKPPVEPADRRAVGAKVAGARRARERAGAGSGVAGAGSGVPDPGAPEPVRKPGAGRTGAVTRPEPPRRVRKGPGAPRGAAGQDGPRSRGQRGGGRRG